MTEPDTTTRMYTHRSDVLCDDVGDGAPIVFAHGTLMDRTMFQTQIEALNDEYRVVAYDLRARTDRWMGPYHLDDLVEDCRAFIDARRIDSCVLGGMSMGGFMGLRFALEYPDYLDGLVLIDSMAMPHDEGEKEQYGGMIEQVKGEDRPSDQLADVVTQILFGGTTNAENEELVEEWVNRWKTYPGDAIYHEVSSWLDRPGVTDRLDEIDVPTLIVHGEEDMAIEPERGEAMLEKLPDARMVRVPEAGHSSNVENPGVVNEAVREFLADVY
ncbi:MAG: alpha/beta hydrolase [Halobacteria archaeon]|nr:alpha/beta hydrolase [Halobacteria archaeon]